MTQTVAIILFVIGCILCAVASGFGYYSEEMKKKKQKEELEQIKGELTVLRNDYQTLKDFYDKFLLNNSEEVKGENNHEL